MTYVNRHRLRQLRLERGYSQEDLAQLAGVRLGTISHLEIGHNDNPKVETLFSIAKALGVDVTELINSNTRSR